MEKYKISIIGCCVCRDLFEGDESFEFHTDIRFSSPISMLADPVDFVNANPDHFKKRVPGLEGNWFKKTLINDINKTAFKALKERHGDYLVIDFTEARMAIAEYSWKNQNDKLLVSYSGAFRKQFDANLKSNLFKNSTCKIYPPLSFDDEYWEKTISRFSEKVLEIFKEENIVLIEDFPSNYYVDNNGALQVYTTKTHFQEILECNTLIPRLNEMFKKKCPKVNVIKIPSNALGSSSHKWGTNPFHFQKNYYEYLLKCVRAIIIEKDCSKIDLLFKKYSSLFDDEFNQAKLTAINLFYSQNKEELEYKNAINNAEEFKNLSRRKKAELLFVLSKKEFFKMFKK